MISRPIRNCAVAIALFCSSIWASTGFAQQTTRAEFEELIGIMKGRWICQDASLNHDLPDVGEKGLNTGDKVQAYAEARATNAGHRLQIDIYHSGDHSSWGLAFDAGQKQIVSLFVTSSGVVERSIVFKEGDQWVDLGSGSDRDKQKLNFRNTLTISDDGKTHTWNLNRTVNGESETVNEVWKRISGTVEPASGSESFQEFGNKLAGRWMVDITYVTNWDGTEGSKAWGYEEYRWSNDGKVLIGTGRDSNDSFVAIYTWDPIAKQIFSTRTNSGGVSGRATVTRRSSNEWLLRINNAGTRDGKELGGAVRFKFSEDGKRFDTTGHLSFDDKLLTPLDDHHYRVAD